jgi:glycerol-1-phosphate dehydrogenase [NAD(P)+]
MKDNYMWETASTFKNVVTKKYVNVPDCLSSFAKEYSSLFGTIKAVIIFDENTKKVAGDKIISLLLQEGIACESILLESKGDSMLTPSYGYVKKLVTSFPNMDFVPVAVGSGTINDLVKRAAFEVNKPYISVPTASSVDGFCSYGAALIVDEYKITLECPAPKMIFADPLIMLTAPASMTASGYGDLYSKVNAGADWILADKLGIESIDPVSWEIVQKDLRLWVSDPVALTQKSPKAISSLFEGLSAIGFAMQIYGDSRPASGAEHLISHIWEMENVHYAHRPVFHGEKVAVGTLIAIALQKAFYSYPIEGLQVESIVSKREKWEDREKKIHSYFPSAKLSSRIITVCKEKWISNKAIKERLVTLQQVWPQLKEAVFLQLSNTTKIKEDLEIANCPVSLADIGLSSNVLKNTLAKAQMIRTRYTILDIIYECNLFDEICGNIKF